jgi:hypothetical protein
MPARAARDLRRRWRASGTLRIWIIPDMCNTYKHATHMSTGERVVDYSYYLLMLLQIICHSLALRRAPLASSWARAMADRSRRLPIVRWFRQQPVGLALNASGTEFGRIGPAQFADDAARMRRAPPRAGSRSFSARARTWKAGRSRRWRRTPPPCGATPRRWRRPMPAVDERHKPRTRVADGFSGLTRHQDLVEWNRMTVDG